MKASIGTFAAAEVKDIPQLQAGPIEAKRKLFNHTTIEKG